MINLYKYNSIICNLLLIHPFNKKYRVITTKLTHIGIIANRFTQKIEPIRKYNTKYTDLAPFIHSLTQILDQSLNMIYKIHWFL